MVTIPITAATLKRPLAGRLRCSESPATAIVAELSYTSNDPYAVTLTLRLHHQVVPWIFARDLLSRGLVTPSGDGDVHIWADQDDEGRPVVTVELCCSDGYALVELPIADVCDFIMRSHNIVAPGEEWRHLDIDAALAAIRAAEAC